MNDALFKGTWNKSCIDIYVTIEYPNYSIISFLTLHEGSYMNWDWEIWDTTFQSYLQKILIVWYYLMNKLVSIPVENSLKPLNRHINISG